MRNKFMTTAVLLMLAAPATAQVPNTAPFSSAFRAVADQRVVEARRGLNVTLLDYPTARFRDVQAVRDLDNPQPNIRFCGYVNSKNQLGGYTGWERFFAMGAQISLQSSSPAMIAVLCDGARNSADTLDYSTKFQGP